MFYFLSLSTRWLALQRNKNSRPKAYCLMKFGYRWCLLPWLDRDDQLAMPNEQSDHE
jgi:hypothetical protein